MACEKCNIVWVGEDSNSCPLCKARVEIEELKKKQMDENDIFDLKNQIGEIVDIGSTFSVALDALETTSAKIFDGVNLDADEPDDNTLLPF